MQSQTVSSPQGGSTRRCAFGEVTTGQGPFSRGTLARWARSPGAAGGKTLASAGLDQTVRLWDLTQGKQAAVLEGHTDWVRVVAWSRDGKALRVGR